MKPLELIEARGQAAAYLHQPSQHGREVFLSTQGVCERFGFPSRAAVRMFCSRHGIVPIHAGRSLRFSALDIEIELKRKAGR